MCRGWGNLGEGFDIPDTVMLLDNVPHDWLLPHCCAVVHHGGAGTTAAGQSSSSAAFKLLSLLVFLNMSVSPLLLLLSNC